MKECFLVSYVLMGYANDSFDQIPWFRSVIVMGLIEWQINNPQCVIVYTLPKTRNEASEYRANLATFL
ncbi:MAG: hypothetical protein AUJ28_02670 [Parcubacteria group bacterium CG1_02_37_51]|uniref:Uncharacterized protein n=1 Tax=Candidatus Komeilibacteria bacterium CG_4_10_14_0_8_um_filter_37_78 TaxID=1974471 RepID=A0A2M7RBX0_9BACT|nr:MAG: hypothetical protein AUJ28_02670 [Parcubacteria group bacterium CG1_02_37_51]PIY94061.1 MAG: hypothetical protein COY67_03120 [Candidatus Komeilibacteria bacterium CG_4_10_14_0_8_um_filter_37_78]